MAQRMKLRMWLENVSRPIKTPIESLHLKETTTLWISVVSASFETTFFYSFNCKFSGTGDRLISTSRKMSEKGGGKGYTPASASKGNGEYTGKKRGRKPRVNSEATSLDDVINNITKSVGKGDSSAARGSAARANGSNGDKGGSAKAPVPKEPSKLELRVENDLPRNATCLMDCEAALILEGIQEQMVILSEDPTIKIPISFDKGLQYAKAGDHYTNPRTARQVIEKLKVHGVSDGEICMIANISPDTIDEVFAAVPSLKTKKIMVTETLNVVVRELGMLKHPTRYDDIF